MKLSIWNFLSILGILALIGVVALILQIFINPYNALNPFPPPTLPAVVSLPSETPTPRSLPATWTPIPSMEATATLRASSTPLPTATGFVLPSATPTLTPTITPSLTPTPSRDQAQWITNSPADGAVLSPGADFDLSWTVKNIGTNEWNKNYYYKYSSGWDGQKQDRYSLPKTVATDSSVNLVVDMVAPKDPGSYSLKWKLYNDDDEVIYTVDFVFSVK